MAVNHYSNPEPEARRLCPVCAGLPMRKLELGAAPARLVLDYCARCGGIWFDAGEVDALRRLGPTSIRTEVALSATAYQKRCGKCEASYQRNEDRCPVCRAPNELRCPSCRKLLRATKAESLKVDVCRDCRGVWFDNVELKEIWNEAVVRYRHRTPETTATDMAMMSMDSFLLASLLMPGPSIGGSVGDVAAGAGAIGGDAIADVGGGVLEGTGELAGSVFDKIADLIGGIFDGF